MRDGSPDDSSVPARPSAGWGKLFLGLLFGGAMGAGALYVTVVDPSLLDRLKPKTAEKVEEPKEAAPVQEVKKEEVVLQEALPRTPFEMGTLPPDEPVESVKITLGVGTKGAPLTEAVDVHLGLGFPLRLYPLGGKEREPSFAAFPFQSSLEESTTAVQPGQMASFEFSAKKENVGVDELRTSPQLLEGVKVSDLQSIGFASQGRSDWVLAGYRIEVNGKLFAANGLVDARVQQKMASSRESLMKMLPDYEAKVNKDKLTAEEENALKTEHALVRALSGRVSGAVPWYEEEDEKFKPAAVNGGKVEKLRVTLTSGNGDRPGTRNPLYLQAGPRKYLLSSEGDPLADETEPQIFELAGFELALNPLSKEALSNPGIGVIGSGEPADKVPDRAQLERVLVEADDEAVYDSDKQADDKKALPSFWLTPVAHYDEAGGLVKAPPAQGEVPLWTAGMKGLIPAAGIVPEPPPKVVVGPKKKLPPLLPPQRRTLGGGLPVRGQRGILPFLNTLANLLRPLIAPKAPTVSAVRIAPPGGIVRAGDRVTVTWTANGNTTQINTWLVQLFAVLPHKPGAAQVVFTPLASEIAVAPPGASSFAWPMVQPISVAPILPADLPYAYVMPVVTGLNVSGGVRTIVAPATGSLLPLFPAGVSVANVGLRRGAALPPGLSLDARPQSPAPSFQVSDLTFVPPGVPLIAPPPPPLPLPDSVWNALTFTDPATSSSAWGLNIPTPAHLPFNFDSHEAGFPAPVAVQLAAFNTAARPRSGAPGVVLPAVLPPALPPPPFPTFSELVRLRFEGFVAVPATATRTLRVVAHVGFTGGTDPAALCDVVAARAEISAGPLTPGLFLTNGNLQNEGLVQPFFTVETIAGLPQITKTSPMLLVDMPLRLQQLSTAPAAPYQFDPNPAHAGAYTLLTTNPAGATSLVNATPALDAINAAALAAQMLTNVVYVTVNVYLDLQSTDPRTAVGVFGVRIIPE
ncbi:MAG: hypothetical protein R3F13_11495 [Prosthecobacter sp.]